MIQPFFGASASAAAEEPDRVRSPWPILLSCFGADLSRLREMASRYGLVIWHNHPDLRGALAAVKRHTPRVRGLMYRELFCVLRQETELQESVGGYDWIDANHPEWFQLDRQGRRVEVPDYPGRWMMDLGHPGWQAFWVERTLSDVIAGGWDGVFADDALTTITAHVLPPLAGYPDDASLQQAVAGFLSRIATAFHAANKLAVANAANTYDFPGLWKRWLGLTDGLMEEHFAGVAWTWGDHVAERQLEAMREAKKQGKLMLCLTYGSWDDRAGMETSLAAYLISAGAQAYWSYRPYEEADRPAWHSSWALPLGQPLGEAQRHGLVWHRRFEHGHVLLNPSPSPQSVPIGSRSWSLNPFQGLIVEGRESAS